VVSSTKAQHPVLGQEDQLRLSQAYEELVQDASAMRQPTLPNFAEHLIFLKKLDGCLAHLSSLNDTPDKLPVAHPRHLSWSPSPSGNEVAQPSTCADGSLRTSHARKKDEQSHHRCGQTGASRRGRQVEDCQCCMESALQKHQQMGDNFHYGCEHLLCCGRQLYRTPSLPGLS